MMDITNKAVKVSRAICHIEECLANGDLLAREADDLRIELDELRELDDLLNAYFIARNNGDKLIAERDSALAQNAELVAHILALSQAVIVAEPYVINAYKQCAASWADRHLVEKAAKATPTQHLRDRDAEVGRAGFVVGYSYGWNDFGGDGEFRRDAMSSQYAEKVRRGEV